MEKNNNTEKVSVSSMLLHLLEGVFAGFASGVPFFHVESLKNAMSVKDLPFEKVDKKEVNRNALLKGLDDSNPYRMSFLSELLYLFTHRFTYLVGAIIGFVLFFFVPCKDLINQYPTAIYGGFVALSLGFGFYEVMRIIRNKDRKNHYIPSILCFIVAAVVCFLLLKFVYGNATELWENNLYQKMILVGGFLLAGFLLTFSGMSMMTLFFFSGFLLSVSDLFNASLYAHNNLLLCGLALVGALVGSFVAMIVRRQGKFDMEKAGINLGFYLMGIIFIAMKKIKKPFLSGISTVYAEWITIGTTIAVCLLVSIGLTIRNYGFLKKDKIDEELS